MDRSLDGFFFKQKRLWIRISRIEEDTLIDEGEKMIIIMENIRILIEIFGSNIWSIDVRDLT